MSKFNIGDRVTRKPLLSSDAKRHGAIVEVNTSWKDYKGQVCVIYSVLWDGIEMAESGYMEIVNGLEREHKIQPEKD